MKTEKIKINRTTDQPEGVEIEIVQPESKLEGGVLSFLLTGRLLEAKHNGLLKFDLPDSITVEHRKEGTFVISASQTKDDYYQPPRPIAIVGIRTSGQRFDLVHAELKAPSGGPPTPDQSPAQHESPAPDESPDLAAEDVEPSVAEQGVEEDTKPLESIE